MTTASPVLEFNMFPKEQNFGPPRERKTPQYFHHSPGSGWYNEEVALKKLDSGEWDEFNLYKKPENLTGRYQITESFADCDAYKGWDGYYKPDDFMDVQCDVLDESSVRGKYEGVVAAAPYETDAEYEAKQSGPDWEPPVFDFPRLYHVKIKCWKVTRLSDAHVLSPLEEFLKREAESFWPDYEEYTRDIEEIAEERKINKPKKPWDGSQPGKRNARHRGGENWQTRRPENRSQSPPSRRRTTQKQKKVKGPDADGWYKV